MGYDGFDTIEMGHRQYAFTMLRTGFRPDIRKIAEEVEKDRPDCGRRLTPNAKRQIDGTSKVHYVDLETDKKVYSPSWQADLPKAPAAIQITMQFMNTLGKCQDCHGNRIDFFGKKCKTCDGTGHRTVTGLHAKPTETVLDLNSRISANFGIPPAKVLIFDGKQLEDHCALANYGITNESTLLGIWTPMPSGGARAQAVAAPSQVVKQPMPQRSEMDIDAILSTRGMPGANVKPRLMEVSGERLYEYAVDNGCKSVLPLKAHISKFPDHTQMKMRIIQEILKLKSRPKSGRRRLVV